jgi:hypothetical protein
VVDSTVDSTLPPTGTSGAGSLKLAFTALVLGLLCFYVMFTNTRHGQNRESKMRLK